MKKTLRIALVASMALSLVACNKEVENVISNDSREITLSFKSARPSLTDAETRTAWDGSTINWSKGDNVRIAYTVNGFWQGADGEATPAKLYASKALSDDTAIAEFEVSESFTDSENEGLVDPEYKFYGIYPSSLVSGTDFTPTTITFTLPSEQTPAEASFANGVDVMYATSDAYEGIPADRKVDLTWHRVVSHADISMRNVMVEEGETLESITVTAQAGADLTGQHTLDITDGTIALPSGKTGLNYVTVNADKLTFRDGAVEFWFTTLPFTATELTFTVKTDKFTYVRTFTGINLEFLGNARNTLSVNMKKADKFQDYTESFSAGKGEFTISGDDGIWTAASYNDSHYMKATSRINGTNTDGTAWLISPFLSINSTDSELSFEHAINGYFGTVSDEATVWAREKDGEWTKVSITYPNTPASGFTDFEPTSASLSAYNGKTIQIGFKYIGAVATGVGTWEVKDFKVTNCEVIYYPTFTFIGETTKQVAYSGATVEFAYEAAHLVSEPTVSIKTGSDDIIEGTPSIANGKITVVVKANNEEVVKTATLVVTCEGVDNIPELVINQEAKQDLVPQTATIDFTAKGFTNGQVVTSVVQDPFTVTFTKGGSNDPKYYTSNGGSMRFYTGGTMTVSSEYTITKIVMTGTVAATVGGVAVSSNTWSGLSNSVVFTATATNQIKTLTITYQVPSSAVPKYSVNIATGIQHGTITATPSSNITEGTSVTLTITPDDGYELQTLIVDDANVTSSVSSAGEYTFTMPSHDVAVSAVFMSSSVTPGDETTVEVVMSSQTASGGVITFTQNGLTFTFDKRTGSTNPTWNANSSQLRLYAKGALSISGKTITKVVYTYTVNKSNAGKAPEINSVAGATNAGSWDADTNTWSDSTGDSNVTMDLGGEAGNFGFTKITVTYK